MDQIPSDLLDADMYIPISTGNTVDNGNDSKHLNSSSRQFTAKVCERTNAQVISEGCARYNNRNRALAIARGFASYGDTKAMERCINEHLNNDDDCCSTSLETTFDYYCDCGMTNILPTGSVPAFVMTRNTTLSFRPWRLFDTSGQGEGEGEGLCHAALALSDDVHIEVYTFDGIKDEGTVTLYKKMGSGFCSTPCDDDKPNVLNSHSHLTLRFYKRGDDILWHNEYGDDERSSVGMQLTLLVFQQNTMHYKINRNGCRNVHATLQHVETNVLKPLIEGSRTSSHEAYTLIYMTGKSWKYDPPMKTDYDGNDVMCSVGTEDIDYVTMENGAHTSSLKQALKKEYPGSGDDIINRRFIFNKRPSRH